MGAAAADDFITVTSKKGVRYIVKVNIKREDWFKSELERNRNYEDGMIEFLETMMNKNEER